MATYQNMFGCPVGFSDHTEGIVAAPVAVAMGAAIIEKHFTLDRNLPTPDAPLSIEPNELTQMIRDIRIAEALRGSSERTGLETEEAGFKAQILYRLVLKHSKKTGVPFVPEDFRFLRHPDGIDCRRMETVTAHFCPRCDLEAGTLLEWDMLEGRHG